MPSIETFHRHDDAVLWPFSGYDDQGKPTVGSPVEIKVRWIEGRKDMANPAGDAVVVSARAVVDRVVAIHSHMWLGTLDEWYGSGSAGDDIGLMEVVARGNIPDLKGRKRLKTVGLSKLHDVG
jgi:hypothetical protein